eukprot:21464-Heterococcus_DN1.PRE.4
MRVACCIPLCWMAHAASAFVLLQQTQTQTQTQTHGLTAQRSLHACSSQRRQRSCASLLRMSEPEEEVDFIDDAVDDEVRAVKMYQQLQSSDDPTTVDTIIYKRLDETYNINPADYDGAFEEPEIKEDYDTNPKNAAGERMLRVLMVGGSSSEAKILQSLSELDDLVCGTYVAWDDSMGPLHDTIPSVPYMNLYPCQNPADPNMHAELASFIYADVVVAGGSYSSQSKASFLQQLEAKATELGVGYVGPDGAAAMLNGDFSVLKLI